MIDAVIVKPEEMRECAERAAQIRHSIHCYPEVGLNLTQTEKTIVEALKSFGCETIETRVGGADVAGVVCVIKGDQPGRTIGLRADSDALPLNENTGLPYASTRAKHMHACGHDGHVATLLAVVKYFMEHRHFAGTLVAIFQPGEEGFAGARYMVEDGLVERFGIDEFYALHAEPSLDVGSVGFVPGYATANADAFEIVFEGQGGHGSRPQFAKDSIVAMGEAILALQTIVSRNVAPNYAAVVSICCAQSGDPNGTSVMPQKALLRGTTRSYEPEVQDLIERRMNEIAQGIAQTYGIKAKVNYTRLYPAMYNTPENVQAAREIAAQAIGAENVKEFSRTAGGEDFSFMLLERPGCLFRLGMKDADHTAPVHNEQFDFNDKAIATGAAVLASIALTRMKS